ncbi:hypothetical protein K4L06_08485 [Lysobacter sp. BMK333-48F3]|uniref:hypothetical protein n=1 Tax=Lysobacter sp. BMK333-48F3 TaxID=2867962 RepID=UPI001C8CD6D1|nr:hypothetical protein [Lysobacter sp. BMK333-48F3]MBX9401351.1 hypothetical protein [Lysobacter sp. BMK333-48F3]
MFRVRALSPCLLAVAAAFVVVPSAQAHETVPPDWCLDSKREAEIVGKFEFDGGELREVAAKCGIVEKDDWLTASATLAAYCKIVAPLKDAVPFVFAPDSYAGKGHHTEYRLDDGATGVCAVCPPPPAR